MIKSYPFRSDGGFNSKFIVTALMMKRKHEKGKNVKENNNDNPV